MRRSGTFAAGALLATALTFGGSAAAGSTASASGYAGPARGIVNTRRIANGSAQFTSRNWDGYITYAPNEGTDFDAVKATWVQPTVTCEATDAWTVFWVGLDGWFPGGTVEQGGTSARCARKGGAAQYQLWWEMFPTNAIQTVLAIHAGDTVTASVAYSHASSVFTIAVRDVTSGRGFTKKTKCASGQTCNRNSADVITEDVGRFGTGTYFPLANYGTMGYTRVEAIDVAGHAGSITNAHWSNGAVTEKSQGRTYATVSALTDQGTAFTTTWRHK